jgi:hypothetical protein
MRKWIINPGRNFELTPDQMNKLTGAERGQFGLTSARSNTRQEVVDVVGSHASVLPQGQRLRGAMLKPENREDFGIPPNG